MELALQTIDDMQFLKFVFASCVGGERRRRRHEVRDREIGLSFFFQKTVKLFFKKLTIQIKDLQLIIMLKFSIKKRSKRKRNHLSV